MAKVRNYCQKRLEQVDAIITLSDFSRGEIINLLGIDPSRIHVTFPGVAKSFNPAGSRMKGLPSSYVLCVCNLEPRKDLPLLLRAHQRLPTSLRRNHPLIVAGAKVWRTRETDAILEPFQRDKYLFFIGYVHQQHLPAVYRGACLFTYPSLYEGFGLPVLEAMACGTPVLCSGTASMGEVAGEAAVKFDPTSDSDLVAKMKRLLNDPKLRARLAERGYLRARDFSWELCARDTLSVYGEVLGEKR